MMESRLAKTGKQIAKRQKGTVRAKTDFFRTARYGLTLVEHRIIYYAILRGQQSKQPFEPVTLPIKEFQALCELKGQSAYSAIRALSNKIVSKTVEVVYKDEKGLHVMQAPWLAGITYHAKEGSVTIELNKKLQPFIEGKPFSETEYYFLIRFTSQYAERLYEILKTFAFKPLASFEIGDLRQRLGIAPGQYANYNMLRTRVLKPALDDINKFTDLDISLHEKRGQYNRVESVYFTIEKKNVPKLTDRVAQGEFEPPLSEAEQKIFVNQLLGKNEEAAEDEQDRLMTVGG